MPGNPVQPPEGCCIPINAFGSPPLFFAGPKASAPPLRFLAQEPEAAGTGCGRGWPQRILLQSRLESCIRTSDLL